MLRLYTTQNETLNSILAGYSYFLDPSMVSPSAMEPKADPGSKFVVSINRAQVCTNQVPLRSSSLGNASISVALQSEYLTIQKAKKYFEERKSELIGKYEGKFIAIIDESVVDSENDFSLLAERVYRKYGYQTIYMPFVQENPTPIRISSPRLKRP